MVASGNNCCQKCVAVFCKPRVLLTFGIPLFGPAVVLTAIGFSAYSTIGIIHFGGLLLLFISVFCIAVGCYIRIYTKPKLKDPSSEPSQVVPVLVIWKAEQSSRGKLTSTDSNGAVKKSRIPRSPRVSKTRKKIKAKDRKRPDRKLATVTEVHEDVKTLTHDSELFSRNSVITYRNIHSSEHRDNSESTKGTWSSTVSDGSTLSGSTLVLGTNAGIGSNTDILEMTPVEELHVTDCLPSFNRRSLSRSFSLTDFSSSVLERQRSRSNSLGNNLEEAHMFLECIESPIDYSSKV